MYYVRDHAQQIKEKTLFPEAKNAFLFDFELSKNRLLENHVELPCYVVLENQPIEEVIKKFPSEGELKILTYIDKGAKIYENVQDNKTDHIEIINRCDIDFAILYQPLNVVEFLLHLHQGSRIESGELVEECKLYYDSLDEWFFNHKNFFKYNNFFHEIEDKILDRYKRLVKKRSKIKLINCDGKPLVFLNKK